MILSGFPLKCNLQNMHSIPGWRNRNVYLDWAKHSWQYRGYSFRRPDGKACPQPGDSPDGEANRTLLDLLIFFGIAVIAIATPPTGNKLPCWSSCSSCSVRWLWAWCSPFHPPGGRYRSLRWRWPDIIFCRSFSICGWLSWAEVG